MCLSSLSSRHASEEFTIYGCKGRGSQGEKSIILYKALRQVERHHKGYGANNYVVSYFSQPDSATSRRSDSR